MINVPYTVDGNSGRLTIKLDVVGIEHWQQILEGDVDIPAIRTNAEAGSRRLSHRAEVIGFLWMGNITCNSTAYTKLARRMRKKSNFAHAHLP